ncbi:MAG TPA: sigma-70 family RNA polymerase sigma factor [Acidimicrobiales bacterium]|nr:sigma-70 family RNA polymerase sigma factor [Acidimicrobiales bacterium]
MAQPHALGAEVASMPSYVVDDFAVVYARHYRRLVVTLCLSGASLETAEEITQEAFLRAFSSWTRVRLGSNPPGYLYRTSFRLWRRRRRRDARSSLGTQSTPPFSDPASEATTRVALQRAFAALPPKTRTCAALALHSGLDTVEIARILHIKPATVRVHVHNARSALRAALAEAPDPHDDTA